MELNRYIKKYITKLRICTYSQTLEESGEETNQTIKKDRDHCGDETVLRTVSDRIPTLAAAERDSSASPVLDTVVTKKASMISEAMTQPKTIY